MSFSEVIKRGISKIYAEDYEVQKSYLETIINGTRGSDVSVIWEAKGVFIPNNDYMIKYFGIEIIGQEFGCYNFEGECVWVGNLIVPVENLAGIVVGLVGFNPFRYLKSKETKDWSLNYYSYTHKDIFQKGKYLYGISGEYKRAMEAGYLILIDGFFDALSLHSAGFIAMAMLGSTLTMEIIAQLRFIKKIIFIGDNDPAGVALHRKLIKHLNNVVWYKQGVTKDADDLLKSEYRERFISDMNCLIASSTSSVSIASFSKPLKVF